MEENPASGTQLPDRGVLKADPGEGLMAERVEAPVSPDPPRPQGEEHWGYRQAGSEQDENFFEQYVYKYVHTQVHLKKIPTTWEKDPKMVKTRLWKNRSFSLSKT